MGASPSPHSRPSRKKVGKTLSRVWAGSRATKGSSLSPELITDQALESIRALNEIAEERGQTLAQLAVAWVLRHDNMTSALIGASRLSQIEEIVAATANTSFTEEELTRIDQHATDTGINLWARSSQS